MIIDPSVEHWAPIEYVIEEGLATWTEVTEQMNVMEVEHLIHVHTARKSQRARIRRSQTK